MQYVPFCWHKLTRGVEGPWSPHPPARAPTHKLLTEARSC